MKPLCEIVSSLGFIPDPYRREALAEYLEGIPRRKGLLVSQDVMIELTRYCQQDDWLHPGQIRQLSATGLIPGSAKISIEAYAAKLEVYGENATPNLFLPVDFERGLINSLNLWEISRIRIMLDIRGMAKGSARISAHRFEKLLQTTYHHEGSLMMGGEVLQEALASHQERLGRSQLVVIGG